MTIVTCPNCGAKNRVDERAAASRQPVCGRCGTKLSVAGAGGAAGGADGHPVEVTDATFASVLSGAGDRPVLVDCWATWCPPCRMLAPTIDALAAESAGRWVVGKLDTDHNPQTAAQYNVMSIPMLLLFKHGQVAHQIIGAMPKSRLLQEIEPALAA